jgi:hypothetical protein
MMLAGNEEVLEVLLRRQVEYRESVAESDRETDIFQASQRRQDGN